jgi:hypothetical protein
MDSSHPYQERKESYQNFQWIYKERYGEPFPRIVFNLDDRGSSTWPAEKQHSMCYKKDEPERKVFCGPDFTFWHWPRSGVQNSAETFEMIAAAGECPPEINKVAWFGNIDAAGANMPESLTRPMLVRDLGRSHPDRFEFQHAGRGAAGSSLYISMPDMVRKYSHLLDIGGAGYSGRLKFLLFSGRPLFLVDRMYVEFFHDDLQPFVHFIPVKSDLSDLLERHQWAMDNKRASEDIAQNARAYALQNISVDRAIERLHAVFQFLTAHSRTQH